MIRKLFLLIRVMMFCSFLSYLILIDQKHFKNINFQVRNKQGWLGLFLTSLLPLLRIWEGLTFLLFLVCINCINSLWWLTHNSPTRSLFIIITVSFPITAPSLLNLKFSLFLLLLLLHSLNPNRSSGSLPESLNPGSLFLTSINLNRTVFLHSMPTRYSLSKGIYSLNSKKLIFFIWVCIIRFENWICGIWFMFRYFHVKVSWTMNSSVKINSRM